MVYEKRTTQNMGRVARAFNVFTHAAEEDEARSPAPAQVARGLSLKELAEIEYLRYKAQHFVHNTLLR
jgi:hypothetical protein